MKRKLFMLLAVVAVASWATAALATTVTFVTPTGALEPVGNLPVNAQVIFTTTTDELHISIVNLQTDIKAVSQCISGLSFVLSNDSLNSASLTTSSGLARSVASDGTFSDGSNVSTGWTLSGSGGLTGFELNLLGTNPPAPSHTIIGPADGTTYSNANSSITGNGPHNPFLFGTEGSPVEFILNIPGLTASDTITAATFSFNTSAGDNVPGSPVPLPSSLLLLGSGLVPLAVFRGRKRQTSA